MAETARLDAAGGDGRPDDHDQDIRRGPSGCHRAIGFGAGAKLSEPPDQADAGLSARRQCRHHRPHSRPRNGKGLGQSIVVEGKPGLAGALAAEAIARSEPDGYTLLALPSAHPAYGALSKNVKYRVVDDFTWISVASFYRS